LIDLNTGTPSVDEDEGNRQTPSSLQGSVNAAPQRKVQVMKRNPARDGEAQGGRGSVAAARTQQSAEDKEKAYHEARARIFGDSETSTPEGSCSSPVNSQDGGEGATSQVTGTSYSPRSDATVRGNPSSSATLSTMDTGSISNFTSGQVSKCSSSNSLSAGIAAQESSPPEPSVFNRRKAADLHSQQIGGVAMERLGTSGASSGGQGTPTSHTGPLKSGATGNGSKVVPNAATWKGENKSQTRNQDAERADPDFKRNAGRHGGGSSSGGGRGYGVVQGSSARAPPQSSTGAVPSSGAQQHHAHAPPLGAGYAVDPMQAQMQHMQMQVQINMQQMQMQMYHQQQQQQQQQQAVAAGYYPSGYMPQYMPPPGPQPAGMYYPMPPQGGMPYPGAAQYQQQRQVPPGQQQSQQHPHQTGGGFSSNDFPPLG
jgi:hypothetical protein